MPLAITPRLRTCRTRTCGGAVRALAAALLAATALTGCGVRLDTPPPEVPAADATEQARQDAALAAAELHATARSARAGTTDDPEVTAALIAVETAAAEHHAALGGVWEPWPGAGPEATAYPGPGGAEPAPAPASGTPQDVLGLLEDSAAAAREDALTHTGELGRLLASVAISRSHLAADLGATLSVSAQTLPLAPLPAPAQGQIDPEVSRAVDAARYALEVVAARSSGDQRAAAVGRAEQLAAVAGAVAPEEDQREVAYDITGRDEGGTTPEHALAAAAELDVLRAYLTLLASDDVDRDAVVSAATHAASQVRTWDGSLPVLPGLS